MQNENPVPETTIPAGMTPLSYKLRRLKTAFTYPEPGDHARVCDILDEAACEIERLCAELDAEYDRGYRDALENCNGP